MRRGLFGGSFDPIHLGHLAVARAALAELGLEQVVFLPTARPPHKPEREFAPALSRYAMAEIALLDEPAFVVSDAELAADRPVYTIETLARFRAESPADELVLIVGADSLASFDTWRSWEEILASTELGVVVRPGWEWKRVAPTLAPPLAGAIARARLRWVRSVAHPASATEIRRLLRGGERLPDGWIDPRVLAFTSKYSLYR